MQSQQVVLGTLRQCEHCPPFLQVYQANFFSSLTERERFSQSWEHSDSVSIAHHSYKCPRPTSPPAWLRGKKYSQSWEHSDSVNIAHRSYKCPKSTPQPPCLSGKGSCSPGNIPRESDHRPPFLQVSQANFSSSLTEWEKFLTVLWTFWESVNIARRSYKCPRPTAQAVWLCGKRFWQSCEH